MSLTGLQAKVRLGPPDDPDLTVERLTVTYALSGPWAGQPLGVVTHRIDLWRPRLKGEIAGGQLRLGSLDPLLRELQRAPPSAARPPDVMVTEGTLLLATPAGRLRLDGDLSVAGGVLAAVKARASPFTLSFASLRFGAAEAVLRADQRGGRLKATLQASDVSVAGPGLEARATGARLDASLPAVVRERLIGPARIALTTTGLAAALGQARARGGILQADFHGDVDADNARQSLTGRLSTAADAAAGVGSATAGGMLAHLDLSRFVATHGRDRFDIAFDGQGSIAAQNARAGDLTLKTASSAFHASSPDLAATVGGWRGAVALRGTLSGVGGLGPAAAKGLAQALPDAAESYRLAASRALADLRASAAWSATVSDRAIRLTLTSPLILQSASGARLTATGAALRSDNASLDGRATIALTGGGLPEIAAGVDRWSWSRSGATADVALTGRFDALFAKGADVELRGRAANVGPKFTFDLAQCGDVAAERLAFDPNPVTDFVARVCPRGGPLIEASSSGWQARGRIEAMHGRAPSFAAKVMAADADFSAAGGPAGREHVALILNSSRIADTTEPVRFHPVAATGRLEFEKGAWTGDFAVATPTGHDIGRMRLRHDLASGVGRADIDARALAFAPGALQPADLTPMAQFAKAAEGPAAFSGFFAWGPDGVRSGGELVARDLRFRSPAGAVLGLDSDIRFTSLAPMLSAEDQSIRIHEVQGALPLQGLTAVFDFDADGATLDEASAGYSGGRLRLEAMRLPFASGSIYKGALVFDRVDLGKLIAASNLADRVKVQAVVDGRIPFRAGPDGVTIAGGELAAVGPGRISIARAALVGASGGAQPNVAEDFAYQAMENLAFDKLDASVNSIANDRLSMIFHVRGRHDPPNAQQAVIALADIVRGKVAKSIPLPSGTQINLTLDTTLNFGELLRALEETWRESVGQAPESGHSATVQGASHSLGSKK